MFTNPLEYQIRIDDLEDSNILRDVLDQMYPTETTAMLLLLFIAEWELMNLDLILG